MIKELLILLEVFRKHRALMPSTIGNYSVNDGGFFKRIAETGSCNTRTYERCKKWFSENWPEDLEWPAGIPRPSNEEDAA